MDYHLRDMTIDDYDSVVQLWRRTEGIILSDSDKREPMRRFLERNPGLSSVAYVGDELVGAVLCSHDGRRGYLHHLAVDTQFRRRGIGSALVQRSLEALSGERIAKCNIFILERNKDGIAFWQRNGFTLLEHFGWLQNVIHPPGEANASSRARF